MTVPQKSAKNHPAPLFDDLLSKNYTAQSLIADALLGQWKKERRDIRTLLKTKNFLPHKYSNPAAHRAKIDKQIKHLADSDIPKKVYPVEFGGLNDYGGNAVSFAELILSDPSLMVKAGVQWGLFGSAILHLGSHDHHETWLEDIMNLNVTGCFAMTETGHGSNVADIETTATFDPETDSFIINTPSASAHKNYIGAAGKTASTAVVFAQLIIDHKKYGVHAFIVPLRDNHGNFLPGVSGQDNGLKGGLNGVDNGSLAFDNVSINRANLLNHYAQVDSTGQYTSSIDSDSRRFFTMLSTLIQGRVCLDSASVAVQKLVLSSSITYSMKRRQFSTDDSGKESLLLDYPAHQEKLLIPLAHAYAQSFASEALLQQFDTGFRTKDPEAKQHLETLAAVLKPLSTERAVQTIAAARHSTGGLGYISDQRYTSLAADFDIYTTFEGDNTILLQFAARRLLTEFGIQFKTSTSSQKIIALARQSLRAADSTLPINNWLSTAAFRGKNFPQSFKNRPGASQKSKNADNSSLFLTEKTQEKLLKHHSQTIIATIAQKIFSAQKKDGKQAAGKIFFDNQTELIEAARSFGHFFQWQEFTQALNTPEIVAHDHAFQSLKNLRDLFALDIICQKTGWLLAHHQITAMQAKKLPEIRAALLRNVANDAQMLVDAFDIDPNFYTNTSVETINPT